MEARQLLSPDQQIDFAHCRQLFFSHKINNTALELRRYWLHQGALSFADFPLHSFDEDGGMMGGMAKCHDEVGGCTSRYGSYYR